MKVNSYKTCDVCTCVVAKKYGLFFRTDKEYLTVRVDKEAPYYTERNTIKGECHVCWECWYDLKRILRNTRSKEVDHETD